MKAPPDVERRKKILSIVLSLMIGITTGIVSKTIYDLYLADFIFPPKPRLEYSLNPVPGELHEVTKDNYEWRISQNVTQMQLVLVLYNIGEATAKEVDVHFEWTEAVNITLMQMTEAHIPIPIPVEGYVMPAIPIEFTFQNVSGTYRKSRIVTPFLQNLTEVKLQTVTSTLNYTVREVISSFYASLILELEIRPYSLFIEDYPNLLIIVEPKELSPITLKIVVKRD